MEEQRWKALSCGEQKEFLKNESACDGALYILSVLLDNGKRGGDMKGRGANERGGEGKVEL